MTDRTAIALSIGALLVAGCAALQTRQPASMSIAITSSTTLLADDLLSEYDRVAPHVSFEISRGNAETLQSAIATGSTDWGLVTYLPVDSDLWAAPVGTDALALIVHPNNPLSSLTHDEVRAIFQGRTLLWDEVGGAEQPITVVSRESGSAVRGAFDELVMNDLPTISAARLATSSDAALSIVAQEVNAIGYVSLALIDYRVRALAIDDTRPSQETAREGSYPLTTTIRFVAPSEPDGPAGDFLRWVLSDDGQAVVGMHYAPLVR